MKSLRTSKALSKKLYKAGLKQVSEMCWYKSIENGQWFECLDLKGIDNIKYSSYTLEELLNLVPKKIEISDDSYGFFEFNVYYDVDNNTWSFNYRLFGAENINYHTKIFNHKDPKTAVSNLLIWLLDEGHMKKEKK